MSVSYTHLQIGETLKKSGVQLWGRQHCPGTRTAVSAVMSADTDRCFASYGGTGGLDWDILETAIAQTDIVQTLSLIHIYFTELVDFARGYAKEKYDRELWMSGNFFTCMPVYYPFENTVDVVITEMDHTLFLSLIHI